MSDIKRLPSDRKLTFNEGLYFGFGFWCAWVLVVQILIPGVIALVAAFLFIFGVGLTGLMPG